MKLLIVADEPELIEMVAVAARFHWNDAAVLTARDGREGLRLFYEQRPDVAILDLSLPAGDGFGVLREFRRASEAPVLVLGARDSEADLVRALETGADDFVVKPFGHLALLARIKALVRRAEATPEQLLPGLETAALRVDFATQRVWVDGRLVPLGAREYTLLYHLVRNAGRLLDPDTLAAWVWGPDWGAGPADVKALVHRLRGKLAGHGDVSRQLIENDRGRGYRFVLPDEVGRAARAPASVG